MCLVEVVAAKKGVRAACRPAHAARAAPGDRAGATRPPSHLCAGWRCESGTLRDLGSLHWRFKEDRREQPELRWPFSAFVIFSVCVGFGLFPN